MLSSLACICCFQLLAIDTMKTGHHSGCIRPGVNSCSAGFQSRNITIPTPESSIYLHGNLWDDKKKQNGINSQFVPHCMASIFTALYGKYIYMSIFPQIYRGPQLWCIPLPKTWYNIRFLPDSSLARCFTGAGQLVWKSMHRSVPWLTILGWC